MSGVATATASARSAPRATMARVALVGNPNTGKTTLFNRLCGARAKTSNFPGTTTSARIGRCRLPDNTAVEILDLPGIYQLSLQAPEARIVRDVLAGWSHHRPPEAVLVIVDAGNLARNLVLVGELFARGLEPVICLNMTDLAGKRGLAIRVDALAKRLGVPVIPMVAPKGEGLNAVRAALAVALAGPLPIEPPADRPSADATLESLTEWARLVTGDVMSRAGTSGATLDARTDRVDRVLTHPAIGPLVFLVVMGGLFWTLFAFAVVPMDMIEWTFAQLGGVVTRYLPDGPIRDLLTNGVIGGIAGTVVFLPQICFLFFLISLLEDTGYLARAAFVMDKFLNRFGLPGHAFVPLLTSHACALPGIMGTRLIPDRRDRLATIMVAPFMSCSARLPVFVLLTSLLFADRPGLAALAFAACYVLGATAAFLSALLFSKTIFKGRARPTILELPPYQWPSFANAFLTAKDQGLSFLKTAGTVIMAICVVMWWLSAYPRASVPPEALALRAQAATAGLPAAEAAALIDQAASLEARAQQSGSIIGRAGRLVQPVFAPLGYDWQLSVGLLTSFLAREVFVSTMSVLAGGAEDAKVVSKIQTMRRDDGSAVFTPATAASALVFFVLAMQCLPTLAVTRREAGGLRYAALQFAYMSTVAYVTALVVYQSLRAAGMP